MHTIVPLGLLFANIFNDFLHLRTQLKYIFCLKNKNLMSWQAEIGSRHQNQNDNDYVYNLGYLKEYND